MISRLLLAAGLSTLGAESWAQQIPLSPSMVATDRPNMGNITAIVDEQTSNRPQSSWGAPIYSESQLPGSVYLDLGAAFNIQEIQFFDTNGVGRLTFYSGSPGSWNAVVSVDTNAYLQWKKLPVNISSRFIKITQDRLDSNFAEIRLFGSAATGSSGGSITTPSAASGGAISVASSQIQSEGSSLGSPSMLFDEPSASLPNTQWGSWQSPISAVLDLGEAYDIEKLEVFDSNGVGRFEIQVGSPGAWALLHEVSTDGYQVWKTIQKASRTRYLRFIKKDIDANINEIRIFGIKSTSTGGSLPVSSPTPTPTATPAPTVSPIGSGDCTQDGKLVANEAGNWADPFPGHYLYRPRTYCQNAAQKWPLIIFLHGVGECGNGTLSQLPRVLNNQSPGDQIAHQGKHFEAIVAQPQTPYWFSADEIQRLIDKVKRDHRVDTQRIYILGLSMGGSGVLQYAKAYPLQVAAMVPIAPAEGGNMSQNLSGIPTWAAHAFDDNIVHISNTVANMDGMMSGKMIEGLMARYPHQNGNTSLPASGDMVATPQSDGRWKWEPGRSPSVSSKVQVVIYPSGGHDSWSRTLTNAQMWNWLFSQNLGQR